MSMPWFRMYAEFATDAKVQSMSEAMQRRLTMILCLRCSDVTETLSDEELAFQLRVSDEDLAETKALFLRKGFIEDDWSVCNWDKRQFVSDSSAERVRRHRAKRSKQGLPQQNSIRPEVRVAIYSRDGNACLYCGNTEDLTIDHNIPQSRGGSDDMDNLLTACRSCNASKRDLTLKEYCKRIGNETLLKRFANVVDTEEDTEEEKKKEQKGGKPPAVTLPDWLPESAWADWHAFRNSRKGWTHKARELSLRTLTKLHAKGHDPTEVIEKSIEMGWTGLFEIKPETRNANLQSSSKLSAVERVEQAIRERRENDPDDDQDAALARLGYG